MRDHDEWIISGKRVFTGDPTGLWAEAVVVQGNRIGFVGDLSEAVTFAGTGARHVESPNGIILPGFIDGHAHVVMTGASLRKAQLREADDLTEIQQRVRDWAQANPEAPRVLGTGWLHSALPSGGATRELLDAAVPDRPVYLDAHDLHSCWVNTAALRELRITQDTPDPAGGRIERDPDTGEATGHILETAMMENIWPLLNQVSDDELDEQLAGALRAYAQAGVTSAVDMLIEEHTLEAMSRAEKAGRLTLRIIGHVLMHYTGDPAEDLDQVRRVVELAKLHQGDRLRIAGIKIIGDGTIDNCTAAMLEPYTNGGNDDPIWDTDSLNRIVESADAAGLQIAIHAIGDRTVRSAIDALERAGQVNQTSGRRHRIEHLESATPEDIERIGALGITASMQPVHLDPRYLQNWLAVLGTRRAEEGFAWPRYIEAGATLALGTDTPTAPLAPLPNMYIASTRKSPTRPTLPPLRPDWSLPLEAAILHGTRESAYAAHLDPVTGILKTGMAADLIMLDNDPLADGPDSLLRSKVELTMLDGYITHSALENIPEK